MSNPKDNKPTNEELKKIVADKLATIKAKQTIKK
jgi:hypothetical protein